MRAEHQFHGRYNVESHLNVTHHYWQSDLVSVPTSELMAIHRELHLVEGLDPKPTELERIPWYFRVWPR